MDNLSPRPTIFEQDPQTRSCLDGLGCDVEEDQKALRLELKEGDDGSFLIESPKEGRVAYMGEQDVRRSLFFPRAQLRFDPKVLGAIKTVKVRLNGTETVFMNYALHDDQQIDAELRRRIRLVNSESVRVGDNNIEVTLIGQNGRIRRVDIPFSVPAQETQQGKVTLREDVKQFLGQKIRQALLAKVEALRKEYYDGPFLVEVGFSNTFATQKGFRSKVFRSVEEAEFSSTHEFAHFLLNRPENQKMKGAFLKIYRTLSRYQRSDLNHPLVESAEEVEVGKRAIGSVLTWFNESNYVEGVGYQAGHAQDNEEELFASAFNVYKNYRDQFDVRFYRFAPQEVKNQIDALFALIESMKISS